MQVQSAYNFMRGGDIDEIRIYDRMLSDANVVALARGVVPVSVPTLARELSNTRWRNEWWLRYGWNRKAIPTLLRRHADGGAQSRDPRGLRSKPLVVESNRWNSGDHVAGVYNRSRLPGRNDYFQLPDWDCYSLSGKSVTFSMPDELWNHLEISGSAAGTMYLAGEKEKVLFQRRSDQEKTFHRFSTPTQGQKIRFVNVAQEEPIGELSAYYVTQGAEPQGSARIAYTLHVSKDPRGSGVDLLTKFITGRDAADERTMMIAVADAHVPQPAQTPEAKPRLPTNSLPLVHVLIPADGWENVTDGLDGVAIDLPALPVKPTHGEYFPMNIQIRDPLWPQRNLLDFSFSVKPGEPRTLWFDTRDRILPPGKALYLRIAGAGDFDASSLEGTRVHLVFKPRAAAVKEHEIDRFTQARDSFAMMVEERPNDARFNLYNRFAADINDLLRVDPNHWLAQTYWYDVDHKHPKPAFTQPAAPADVPCGLFAGWNCCAISSGLSSGISIIARFQTASSEAGSLMMVT